MKKLLIALAVLGWAATANANSISTDVYIYGEWGQEVSTEVAYVDFSVTTAGTFDYHLQS